MNRFVPSRRLRHVLLAALVSGYTVMAVLVAVIYGLAILFGRPYLTRRPADSEALAPAD